tara:strand:+ start:311 stop:829 length:519 start_codon:yes stop_codon:yes gene_type:complete
MARKALFISVADLKKKSLIDGNVDSSKIVQYIEVAQDIHIQNYLGGKLYKKLQSIIVDGTINDEVNADYKNLLDEFIKPMLVWYTQATILPYSAFTLKNGGLHKHTSENAEAVSKDEVTYLTQRMNDTAEFYTKRFLDYMCLNSNKFTEYSQNSSEDMYPDKEVNYTGGWYI